MIQLNRLSMEGYSDSYMYLDSESIQLPSEAFQRGFQGTLGRSFDEYSNLEGKVGDQLYPFNDCEQRDSLELPFLDHQFTFNLDSILQIDSPKTEEEDSREEKFKKGLSSEQNLLQFYLQGQNQEKSNKANYHRGHIDFLRQLTTPIFLQSRKYWKSKRKMQRGKTYYKFVAKHMKAEQGKSCKRFDQYYLQESFKKLGAREQEERQATLEAIRHLKKYQDNSENKKLLDKHREKYLSNRKWAVFLDEFVNTPSPPLTL